MSDAAPTGRHGLAFDAVLDAAKAGGTWAFERLYEDLAAPVAGYLRTQGMAEVAELTNDVFVRVFRGLSGFEGDEQRFRSWVFTIAHNRIIDERRRLSRRPAIDGRASDDLELVAGDVEQDALAALGDERVRELLDELSPDQRDVVLLRIVADLPIEAVAEALGKRPGSVKALQHRALATLRRRMERERISR
jgi:RNA polymerase sigma-70 factor (ECF subfamily)